MPVENLASSTIWLSSQQLSQLATTLLRAALQQGAVYIRCVKLANGYQLTASTPDEDISLGTFNF